MSAAKMFRRPLSSKRIFVVLIVLMLGANLFKSSLSMSTSASAKPSSALIFLHGLGDSPAGWSHIQQALPNMKPRLANVKYVFPAAPDIPLTINSNMVMPGWFDLYDWPISVGCKDDKVGMMKGIDIINDIVKSLEEKDGIDKSRIVVGGFSQGGAIALLAAYHKSNSDKYAGCACLSGWLTMKEEITVSSSSSKTPLFWAHGSYDDKVLPEQQPHGIDILKPMGVKIEAKQYEMGHQSNPQELLAFAEFLDKTLFEDTPDF